MIGYRSAIGKPLYQIMLIKMSIFGNIVHREPQDFLLLQAQICLSTGK